MRRARFLLPYPPSVNRAWFPTTNAKGRSRFVRSDESSAYKLAVKKTHLGHHPLTGDLRVTRFHVYRPACRGDIDNYFKVVFDALTGVAWHDDAQVKRIDSVEVFEDARNPRVELEVEEYARPGSNQTLELEK